MFDFIIKTLALNGPGDYNDQGTSLQSECWERKGKVTVTWSLQVFKTGTSAKQFEYKLITNRESYVYSTFTQVLLSCMLLEYLKHGGTLRTLLRPQSKEKSPK